MFLQSLSTIGQGGKWGQKFSFSQCWPITGKNDKIRITSRKFCERINGKWI